MGEMNQVQKELTKVIKDLLLMDFDDLEAHTTEFELRLKKAEAMGPIFQPTEYRNAIASGEWDNANVQVELAKHLLEARKIADKLHSSVKLQIITGAFD